MTKLHNDYYTYAYLREDKTPYYIGKGRGKRAYDKRRTIKPPKDKSRIIFLKKNLTEAEAFKHEIYMIFVLGRKDLGTGILRNLSNGGEGPSGVVRSAETKKKMSEAQKGRTHSEETKKKCSEANSGERNPNYGVPHTEEWKQATSERMSGENNPMYGVPNSEAQKKAQSERMSGENNPNYGVPHTNEWKQAMSERMSGKYTGENNPNYGRTGEKSPHYGRTGALSPCSKVIIAIEPDGTQRHFVSGRETARELKTNTSSLCRYLKSGHVLTQGDFKGWQFLFKNSEDS